MGGYVKLVRALMQEPLCMCFVMFTLRLSLCVPVIRFTVGCFTDRFFGAEVELFAEIFSRSSTSTK